MHAHTDEVDRVSRVTPRVTSPLQHSLDLSRVRILASSSGPPHAPSRSEPRRPYPPLCCSSLEWHPPAAPPRLAMALQRSWGSSLTTGTRRARKIQPEENRSSQDLPPTLTSRTSLLLQNGCEDLLPTDRRSSIGFTAYSLSLIGSLATMLSGFSVILLQVRADFQQAVMRDMLTNQYI